MILKKTNRIRYKHMGIDMTLVSIIIWHKYNTDTIQ